MSFIIFIVTFALYLAGMAPSITVGDSGEFCASSVILGLAHSPGYPLYVLLGKIFTLIMPWASLAYRVNLLSAVFGSLTVVILYRTIMVFHRVEAADGHSRDAISMAAAAAAGIFAMTPAFWNASVQAEVFTLNTFFAALIIYALALRKGVAAAFLFGLGMGNHHTLIFVAPYFAWHLFFLEKKGERRWVAMAAAFAGGFSIYLFLMLRAYHTPGLNWGNPQTFHGLWRVISRADYGSLNLTVGEKLAHDVPMAIAQMKRFVFALTSQFTIAGIIAGLAGMLYAWRGKNMPALGRAAVWLLAGPGFLLLANMPFTAEAVGIMERFYILMNLFFAWPVADGLILLVRSVPWKRSVAAGLLAAVIVAGVAWRNEASWRNAFLAYDYGRNILRTLAPGSIFFMDGGDDTFYSTAYLCFAEKRRPDVELHDRGGLVFKNIYGPDFRQLTREEKEARRKQVEAAYPPVRPVYYSTFNPGIMPGYTLSPDGVMYRVEKPSAVNAYDLYALRGIYDTDFHDYRSRALVPIYPYFDAVRSPDKRTGLLRYSFYRWHEVEWMKTNIRIDLARQAYELYDQRKLNEAAEAYRVLVELSPGDAAALVNWGVVEKERGRTDAALELYARAIAVQPNSTEAYYNRAVVAWGRSDWPAAIIDFRKMLEVNPQDRRALHYLPIAEEHVRRHAGK